MTPSQADRALALATRTGKPHITQGRGWYVAIPYGPNLTVCSGFDMALRNHPPMLRHANLSAARIPDKVGLPYYQTPEHKAWREAVIARSGGRCQWPGCGRRDNRMFADHIVEIKDGGARTDLANGQCLCGAHHSIKTTAERTRRLSTRRACD